LARVLLTHTCVWGTERSSLPLKNFGFLEKIFFKRSVLFGWDVFFIMVFFINSSKESEGERLKNCDPFVMGLL
jgi:hypothetical protein